jgi:hypothetical protein
MRKYWLLTAGLVLTSPLLLAQQSTDERDKDRQGQSATTPATPASPASSDDTDVSSPQTDETGTTSGSARSKGQRAGGSANPSEGTGRAGASSSNPSDFGSLDANGDGSLSKDELAGNANVSGRFTELDKNSDGKLSRAEYSTGFRASPSNQGGAKTKSEAKTEGRDKNE